MSLFPCFAPFRAVLRPIGSFGFLVAAAAMASGAAVPSALRTYPNLDDNIERPLRYTPEGEDFVIVNGEEFFNRPLYGGNTAFRSDAGDKPEFTLYLPGRGGNLRLGVKAYAGSKWLFEAERVLARYRPGSMIYEITDPLLGEGMLVVTVLAMHETEGIVVRVDPRGTPAELELTWAFGGATGQRGTRDGDIGTERVPISEYFQLQPEYCRDNTFTLDGDMFRLRSRPATILGLMPAGATLAISDANHWASFEALLSAGNRETSTPVLIGRAKLVAGEAAYLALQRLPEENVSTEELPTYRAVTAGGNAIQPAPRFALRPAFDASDVPRVFAETEAHFARLRRHVRVETPDPFINAAVGALNIGIDAVWDEPQGVVMHGAIAWRSRLLGWRGPYGQDAFGWHERAKRHFSYWATRQNTSAIPEKIPGPDENANLARSEAALHGNGDMSNSHYDMNLVYIDALFRHLLWTGDLELARELWPTIERHLAWERRLFRREFGPDKLPLYEAYAAIWASDDLQYHGGGVTHASAYNYYHNKMAARLARALGHESALYEREAEAILRGMRQQLWLADRGWYAEFKDLLGRQAVHPSAALWTFYHAADSETMTPFEAWQMTRYIDTQIPHLPVRGPGVPTDRAHAVLSTTSWMPYAWSINNVVMGEIVHTALGYWTTGRPEEAFTLTKSSLLAAMYMGICPGNVGSMSYLDVYRRESQRDFADGGGVLARTLIEGLFGVKMDALAGELRVTPGFPAAWDRARLDHPDLSMAFERHENKDTYTIVTKSGLPMPVHLNLRAPAGGVESVTIGGEPARWESVADAVGAPRIVVHAPAASGRAITVTWRQSDSRDGRPSLRVALNGAVDIPLRGVDALAWSDPQRAFSGIEKTAAGLRGAATGTPGHRTLFVQVKSGTLAWWEPVAVEITAPRDEVAWHALARSGKPFTSDARFEPVALAAHFNDRVTQIFRNEYRSPRSPFVSLALPKQGIGGWAGGMSASAEIDDIGVREVAAANGERITTPAGVPFAVPAGSDARNALFVSQWDNYPGAAVVPLAGRAHAAHLLMAGSTNWMQSRFANGEVIATYADGSTARLVLENPTTWWPIDQDYFIDDFQFRRPEPLPMRLDLKTGKFRALEHASFKGTASRNLRGGAATILALPLDPQKELRSLTIRALANEVVIALMAVTLER